MRHEALRSGHPAEYPLPDLEARARHHPRSFDLGDPLHAVLLYPVDDYPVDIALPTRDHLHRTPYTKGSRVIPRPSTLLSR
jgi:hypothetical protein